MAGENGLKMSGIEHARFHELEESRFVFGATNLKGNGCEVLGREDARFNLTHPPIHRFRECFFDEGA